MSVELTGTATAMETAGSTKSTWAREKCMVVVVVAVLVEVTFVMMGRDERDEEQKVNWSAEDMPSYTDFGDSQ